MHPIIRRTATTLPAATPCFEDEVRCGMLCSAYKLQAKSHILLTRHRVQWFSMETLSHTLASSPRL